MKMKKILTACVIFCLLTGGVYAQTDNSALINDAQLLNSGGGVGGVIIGGGIRKVPSYKNNTISFEIETTAEPGSYASVKVVKETDDRVAVNAYAIEEVLVGEDGCVKVDFEMPETRNGESTDGEYIIDIYTGNGNKYTYSFTYVTTKTREYALDALSTEGKDGILEVMSENSEYRDALVAVGFDFELYDNLSSSDKEYIADSFAKGSDKSSDMMKTLIAVKAIEKNDSETVLDMVNPTYNEISYAEIEDKELKSFINKYIKNADIDEKNFNEEYACANVLYTLNNAKYNEITDLMEDNEKLLGLNKAEAYDDFENLTSAKKTEACENVVRKLKNSPAETREAFVKILESSIPASKNNTTGGGGGGGGSKSTVPSGSSNSIVTTLTPVEPEIVKAEEVFDDMANAQWAVPAVEALYSKGIISGVGEKSFAPMSNITREAFITMVVKAMEIETNSDKGIFTDVAETAWYAPFVNAAYREQISMGVSDTEFGVGKLLTRQDMMTMISRLINDTDVHVRSVSELTDFDEVSEYAKASIQNLYERGFVSGKGGNRIAPKDYTTRAEAAQMIYMMLGELNK